VVKDEKKLKEVIIQKRGSVKGEVQFEMRNSSLGNDYSSRESSTQKMSSGKKVTNKGEDQSNRKKLFTVT